MAESMIFCFMIDWVKLNSLFYKYSEKLFISEIFKNYFCFGRTYYFS